MRIGINVAPLNSPYPTSGIPRVVREILPALQKVDYDNDYYLYCKHDFDVPLENPRWHKRLHLGVPYLLSNAYIRLKEQIERRPEPLPDVYWNTGTHRFPFGLPSSVARVQTVYDVVWLLYPETMARSNRLAIRLLAPHGIRQADRIIAISESTRRGLIELAGAPGDKIEVAHLAVNSCFRPHDRERSARLIAQKYGASQDYICTVGTVEPRKNMVTLIEAMRILRGRGQLRQQLLIAGDSGWKNSNIYTSVQNCGLAEREVRFLGRIPDEDLPLFYSGARLFVFPSIYEGFGLPVLEAMACGTPVVASNTSSIPEVAGDTAILVSPQHPEDFADAIARVTGDDGLSCELAEKGLKRAAEFTWEAAARKVVRVFEKAMNREPSPNGRSRGRD